MSQISPNFDVETQVEFCSEPIAAAAYYGHEICRDNFKGVLLVIDFGGRTLDLTLCNMENTDRVLVMKRCGDTGDDDEECGGEAFDAEVTKRILADINYDEKKFLKIKDNFEDAKIEAASKIDKLLRYYYIAPDDEARKIIAKKEALLVIDNEYEEYSVCVNDIVEAFNKVNMPVLKKCIDEIKAYCSQAKIMKNKASPFRIIFTGGFSNLYCVEATVRKMFDAPFTKEDKRFDFGINREFRSTAIAHGAGIIAEGKMQVDIQLQKNIGLFYFDVFNQEGKKIAL